MDCGARGREPLSFRFSIRDMFILTLVAALVLGFVRLCFIDGRTSNTHQSPIGTSR